MGDADTIAAIATAPGRGGIGVVRVSGQDISGICQGILGRLPRPRHATVAAFRGASGDVIDTGIALYFAAPESFTGENVLELQGHGGPVVMGMVLERCVELGARLAAPGEFTRRAFLNDKLDLAQAEAVADLIDAGTVQAARSAQRSLRGDLSLRINAIQDGLSKLRAFVEATLDFPEEEIEFLERADALGRLDSLRTAVAATLESARHGRLLRDGIRVVLAGRPNVGKSSLLNRLAGDDVAIVTEHPGTTRDLIRQDLQIRGVPLHVVDSAGLRCTADPVERIGIDRTWREIRVADVILHVTDAHSPEDVDDAVIAQELPAEIPRIRVFNKIDLSGTLPHVERTEEESRIWVSALTGDGTELLTTEVLALVGWSDPGDGVFIARIRHVDALRIAAERLAAARREMSSLDLFAEELRLAQQALSGITGGETADELLGKIFATFCIGK